MALSWMEEQAMREGSLPELTKRILEPEVVPLPRCEYGVGHDVSINEALELFDGKPMCKDCRFDALMDKGVGRGTTRGGCHQID